MIRKRFKAVLLLMVIAVAAGWSFNQNKKETQMSELALANVEALAVGESSDLYHKYFCGGNNNYYKCILCSGESCSGPNKPYPC